MNSAAFPMDGLEPIGLKELNESASLLTRKDRKYVVPISLVHSLIAESDVRVLEIDGQQSFRYESVYFDTPDRVSYLEAAHKHRRRFKVRTRSYLDSGICSLEVKIRERRGLTEKHRLVYPIEQKASLDDEALAFAGSFEMVLPHIGDLAPVLTTRYQRTTLLEHSSKSRITIDTGLECEAVDGSKVFLPGMAVIETKTPGPPCPVDHLLCGAHQRPVKISKFCTGLAALTPGLPANKWNRVLRTHFGWIPEASPPPEERQHAVAAPLRDTRLAHAQLVPHLGGARS
jgi:hypothetical protein